MKNGVINGVINGRDSKDMDLSCRYCKGKGHWKADCPKLLRRGQPVPMASTSSAQASGGPSPVTASRLVAAVREVSKARAN